jgi:SnoaL-like polyketide cyclase
MPEQTSEQNKTLARRWFEDLFSRGDLDAANEIISADFVDHLTHEDERGLEELKHHVTMYRTAFPDIQDTTVEDIVANQAATQQSHERLTTGWRNA